MSADTDPRTGRHVLVLGLPTGERVSDCATSLRAAGHEVDAVSYRALWESGQQVRRLIRPGTIVRVESPSDDPAVDAWLVELGGGHADGLVEGGLLDSAAWVRGLDRVLGRLDAVLEHLLVVRLYHRDSVLTMFDKVATHRRLAEAGVPVAPALDQPAAGTRFGLLREAAEDGGWSALMVKARYGSSGFGICALRWSGSRLAAYSTVGLQGGAAVNVRPYRLTDPDRIQTILTAIECTGGVHVERWLPKYVVPAEIVRGVWQPGSASERGGTVDLRVVVIDGRARQILVRVGDGPFNNLHLGGSRGSVPALRKMLGEERWRPAIVAAELAAAQFPRAHHAGVDVGLDTAGRPFVLELNAFGDHHVGVLDGNGLDSYQAEIRAAPRHRPAPTRTDLRDPAPATVAHTW